MRIEHPTPSVYTRLAEAFTLFAQYDQQPPTFLVHNDGRIDAGPDPLRLPKHIHDRIVELGWEPDYDGECFHWKGTRS